MQRKKAAQKRLFKTGQLSQKKYAVICKELKHKKQNLWQVKAQLFDELRNITNEDLGGIEKLIFG